MNTNRPAILCATGTAGALALTVLAVAPAGAVANDPAKDLSAGLRQTSASGVEISSKKSAELATSLEAVASPKRTAKAITSDSDYSLQDTYADAFYDTYAVPGLMGASIAVPRTSPSILLGVGLLDTYSSGYDTVDGAAALMIDANADGATDFMAMTPNSYMSLSTGYTTPITKKVGTSWVSTGQTASWLRGSDYYGVALDWKQLGIQNVRWTVGVIDGAGLTDHAPDNYATPVDLAYGQTVTPPPTTGGGTVQSLPAKVGKIRVIKRKGRVNLDWPDTPGATSYLLRVSTNGSKYRKWGTQTASKATMGTEKGKTYSVEIRAKNAVGNGPVKYKVFVSR